MVDLGFIEDFKKLFPVESFTVEVKYKEDFVIVADELYKDLTNPETSIVNVTDVSQDGRKVKATFNCWAGVKLLEYSLMSARQNALTK